MLVHEWADCKPRMGNHDFHSAARIKRVLNLELPPSLFEFTKSKFVSPIFIRSKQPCTTRGIKQSRTFTRDDISQQNAHVHARMYTQIWFSDESVAATLDC